MTKLQKLSMAVLKAQVAFEREKELVKAQNYLGNYPDMTVYLVRSTKVAAHRRRAYKAVRVKI